VKANIHGHGALGDLYPDYNGGDIWSSTLGGVRGIKEGDTPSFLALVPNGLTDLDRPWLGSWGGRFEGEGGNRTDVPDADLGAKDDPDPRMSSVYRWRPAFQADFQARLDWCIKPFAEANHPPRVRITGDSERVVKPGDVVELDAGGSDDPDGDALDFSWSVYPTTPDLVSKVVIEGRDANRARVVVGRDLAGATIPILLSAADRGQPRLTRYARALIRVERGDSRETHLERAE
jgi:hypothetical protein